MNNINFEKGSFRDPTGNIFYKDGRVYRLINNSGLNQYYSLKNANIIQESIDKKFLIPSKEVKFENSINDFFVDKIIIEHQKINYISYPYEWSFDQLKDAAIHHLEFHEFLLQNNFTLTDASAYNIQFIGAKIYFIDLLSLKKYNEGDYWVAHKQFCENFLNPLILKSIKNVDFNNWFRGNLEGISTKDLNSVLSFKDKLSLNMLTHVVLLNYFDQKVLSKKKIDLNKIRNKKLSKRAFLLILKNLKKFIKNLKQKKSKTVWDDYSKVNTYNKQEEDLKKKLVSEFASKYKFNSLLDLGCNNGTYSKICLDNGCKQVIGFDYDLNTINEGYLKAKKDNLDFLPLYFDASNPSSDLGWYQNERMGFLRRLNFSGMISLAFEHHIAIAKNVPLDQTIEWLTKTAPYGLIEFVPKEDETIKKMLFFKGDIFKDYNEENFVKILQKKAQITSTNVISKSGRKIFEYRK